MRNVYLAFLIVVMVCCSHSTSVIYRSVSPDGRRRIDLTTFSRLPLQPRTVVELKLSSNGDSGTVLKSWEASEVYPCFAAAAWSRDSARVIAVFRDCWHGSEVLAFDVGTKARIEA